MMTKLFALRASGAALLLALLPAVAAALPGQTIAPFLAWANANPALHGLTKKMNEMSAQPYWTATFRAGDVKGNFLASGDGTKIVDENVAVDSAPESYSILKHLDVASQMLATVYGPAVAADFKAAPKAGAWTEYQQAQQTVLYRGKLYGYEAAFAWVKLIPVSQVDAEAKLLKTCASQECGD